ncbi:MAG: ATPase [Geobacteraceae bacterium GWC2_58_44]|nr:MAG: ATPase [Geobacteraceae bacterium GWC2_58_44]HBG05157.1 ATP-binding protein [Geobacter sp.]
MLEALRGLGYNTATALADIVDNSIAAGARVVSLNFCWKGRQSTIIVMDDGAGMSPSELDLAMRLGEKNPLELRPAHDLGRFGLGLKTASFSQCRRLTVAASKDGHTASLRWDLDVIAESKDDGWLLLEGPAKGSQDLLKPLEDHVHGTLVLWENLDRIVTEGYTEQNFLDTVDRVEQHLAMVFHRFLEGPHPRLRILINDRPVTPWNPFHFSTWSSPVERIPTEAGPVEVQCHVLPHRDRLDQRDYEIAGGPEGWTAQQGFYVYRKKRLLLAGSWLGLGHGRSWTKEEAHRLARIRLDIPDSADAEWKLDIRKSSARPPVSVRSKLTRLAEDTRSRARQVFAHRGNVRAVGSLPLVEVWKVENLAGGVRYRIDMEHPAVRAVLDDAGPILPQVKAMLRVIEETVPVQRIWLDTAEGKDVPRTQFAGNPSSEVLSVLEVMYRNMIVRKGMSPCAAKELLLHTEPFQDYPELVKGLPDQVQTTK